jgi:hypothetical protein
MHPALTYIQNDVRAAELKARAERDRSYGTRRSSSRAHPEERPAVDAAPRESIFGSLFFGHGYFGREHGTHA